ncbi:hypothetical protein ACFLTZ_05625 [Chloroflexota bacterium]
MRSKRGSTLENERKEAIANDSKTELNYSHPSTTTGALYTGWTI